ncbi:hypothetical protein EV182_007454, partial [Spiromyces aspiralis]
MEACTLRMPGSRVVNRPIINGQEVLPKQQQQRSAPVAVLPSTYRDIYNNHTLSKLSRPVAALTVANADIDSTISIRGAPEPDQGDKAENRPVDGLLAELFKEIQPVLTTSNVPSVAPAKSLRRRQCVHVKKQMASIPSPESSPDYRTRHCSDDDDDDDDDDHLPLLRSGTRTCAPSRPSSPGRSRASSPDKAFDSPSKTEQHRQPV